MSEEVLVERRDGLVTVTLNRPEKKNALDAACWQALDAVFAEVAVNAEDRALLLTGAGGNFSSGADLSGSGGGGLAGGEMQLIVTEMRIVGEIIRRLERLPKPTIAAVDGVAVGVGLGLALACDLLIASDRARFCAIFAKRGLALDGGSSWTLPRQIGLRRAKQMAFFGDMVEAPQALEWGLANEVAPADALAAVADDWARRLAAGPTAALALSKRMLEASVGSSFEEALEEEARAQHVTYTTSDMMEGISAFLERRDPRFTGK
jgi:2-(1,2-epoxy-1,2-dihydrophenyl)acetyl-CoA isomerase